MENYREYAKHAKLTRSEGGYEVTLNTPTEKFKYILRDKIGGDAYNKDNLHVEAIAPLSASELSLLVASASEIGGVIADNILIPTPVNEVAKLTVEEQDLLEHWVGGLIEVIILLTDKHILGKEAGHEA